jgi:ArsR family transcriptional regulator
MTIKEGELNVNEIVAKINSPQSVVSQHLSMMKSRGILETKKNGSFVSYKLKYPEILDALEIMKKVRKKIKEEK